MTATLTKVAEPTIAASARAAMLELLDTPMTLIERMKAREAIKRDAQRAWVRSGRVGPNPIVFL